MQNKFGLTDKEISEILIANSFDDVRDLMAAALARHNGAENAPAGDVAMPVIQWRDVADVMDFIQSGKEIVFQSDALAALAAKDAQIKELASTAKTMKEVLGADLAKMTAERDKWMSQDVLADAERYRHLRSTAGFICGNAAHAILEFKKIQAPCHDIHRGWISPQFEKDVDSAVDADLDAWRAADASDREGGSA